MFPESTFLFECACSDDPALRVAGVNRGLEGLACDVFRDMIRYAEAIGDEKMRQAIDYVLADELTHVRFGSEWVREFTQATIRSASSARRSSASQVDKQFSFGGARSRPRGRGDPDRDGRMRREAGFTEEELDELTTALGRAARRARRCARRRRSCASGTSRSARRRRRPQ